MKRFISIFLLAATVLTINAQEEQDSLDFVAGEEYIIGLLPKQEPPALRQLSVSGFYRFFGTYTVMDDPYLLNEAANQSTVERSLFLADDAQLPNLWMNLAGRPAANMSFNMDVFMFQFMDNNVGESYGTQVADSLTPPVYDPMSGTRLGSVLGLNLGINLYGTYNTDIGSFTARMGGTHWYQLSDLTFASFRGYNRFTLFERNPWDPVTRNNVERYSSFYNEGSIQQDTRWGSRAFHGLILEGARLPKDMSFSLLYGKTELNGGFNPLPNSSIGGRLRHDSEKGFQSYNSFNSHTFLDSLAESSIGFNVHTLEIDQQFEDFKLHAEVGAGRYYAPGYDQGWGEAINLKLATNKELFGFPLEVHYFRIAPQVINNNAIFWNTSITEVTNNELPAGVAGSTDVLRPFASSLVPIGLMTNNRTGLNLNADVEIGRMKLSLGYGFSGELEAISNVITYSHAVNQLTRSRFWRFNFLENVGPYDRYNVVYRDAYQSVQLTDDNFGEVVNKKYFSNAEVQAKYEADIMGKRTYFFFLGRYATAQPEFSPLIPLDESAYIRHYSNELEIYMELSKAVLWTSYLGYERILGNYDTEVDLDSRRPRNQEGHGIGTGVDIALSKSSVFSLRHRYFFFEDKSFVLDTFSGQETLAEIKVFF